MTGNPTYAAGWYPTAPGTERYYDGMAWTAQTRPAVGPTTSPVAFPEELQGKRRWYKRPAIIVPVAVVGGIVVISAIATAVSGSDPVADDKPTSRVVEDRPTAEDKPEPIQVEVPNVVGMTGSDAVATLAALGLEADYDGDLTMPVTAQNPGPGARVEKGSRLTFTLQEKPTLTVAQSSAVRSAQSYLSHSGFSRAGLINQLTSEYGEAFAPEDAEFGVAHLEQSGQVDWNQEAVQSAESYLRSSGFSRQGLFRQLTSQYGERFTADQANFALDTVGLY